MDEWGLYASSGQRKYLTADERRRFMIAADAASPELRTLCLTLAHLGCRLSEALALTAGDVEIEAGLVAIRSLKKRGRMMVRQVPAPRPLLDHLARVHGLGPGSAADRRLWRWQRTRAWQLVKGVMATAEIYRLPASPKELRHGYGVHAVLSGVPLSLVQRWLGHADISTTAIFLVELAQGDYPQPKLGLVPAIAFGAMPLEPLVPIIPRRTSGLLATSRQFFESAGGAWASSLRAALPMYRHNPTVRTRSTPCRQCSDDVDRRA